MHPHRLLITAAAYLVFGLQISAQPASPTPTPANDSTPWIETILTSDTKEELIYVAAGGVVAVFVIWRARRGTRSYHVNQFRVSFTVGDCSVTPAKLSKILEEKFGEIFEENPHARAVSHPLGGHDMIQFRARGVLAGIHKVVFLGRRRVDDVVKARPRPGDSVFHVLTLRFDTVRTEMVKGKPQIPPTELLKTSPRKSILKRVFDFSFMDQHFLAGVRSWRIAPASNCAEYGEPVPAPGCDVTFFLETAALERYSHITYKIIRRGAIEETWQDFLCKALTKFAETVETIRPVGCGRAGNEEEYKLNGRLWERGDARKWEAGDTTIEIWQRDTRFSKKQLKALGEGRGYGPRLFSLHPGIREEYHDALKQ